MRSTLGIHSMLVLSDLTTMALFAEVVERRSFTAAAATAGMAKATVSRRIADLEARLGVRLLQRTTRRVTPTEDGQRIYEQCVRLVAAAKEATEVLSETYESPAGLLRVGAGQTFAQLHLGAPIAEFLQRFPDIQLQMLASSGPSDLVTDEIDVAFRLGQPKDSSIVVRRLALDTIVAVASPAYLERRGTPQRLEDLQDHTCIRLSWEAERPKWRFRGGKTRSLLQLRGNLVGTDSAFVREAAAGGLGIAILPSFVVAAEVRAGRLTRLLERAGFPRMPINLIYPERKNLPMRVRTFIDFMVDRIATRSWRREALLPAGN